MDFSLIPLFTHVTSDTSLQAPLEYEFQLLEGGINFNFEQRVVILVDELRVVVIHDGSLVVVVGIGVGRDLCFHRSGQGQQICGFALC